MDITKTQVSIPSEATDKDEDTSAYTALTFTIYLEGQVPKLQNFLLALDDNLPTCEVREFNITIAEEGGGEDTANLTIDVFCYESSE